MNRKNLIIIGVIVGALLLGVIGWQLYRASQLGALEITVSPSDAFITVDNQKQRFSQTLQLNPGNHRVEVTRTNFQTQSFTIEVKKGETITKNITLVADNDTAAADWQGRNLSESLQGEAKAGKAITEGGAKVTADNPILNRLPYVTSTFRIDFGTSLKYPDDPNAVALYLTVDGEAGKTKALDWLRSQGFDPDKFEIIYQEGGFGD